MPRHRGQISMIRPSHGQKQKTVPAIMNIWPLRKPVPITEISPSRKNLHPPAFMATALTGLFEKLRIKINEVHDLNPSANLQERVGRTIPRLVE
jgi:hypothetical protein